MHAYTTLVSTTLLVLLGWAPSVRADETDSSPLPENNSSHDLVVPIGLNFGMSPSLDAWSPIYGIEGGWLGVSWGDAGYIVPWGGVYADGIYDQGRNTGRFSLGPQLGLSFIGMDLGLVTEVGAEVALGVNARAFLVAPIPLPSSGHVPHIVFLKMYARTGSIFYHAETQHIQEYGIVLHHTIAK